MTALRYIIFWSLLALLSAGPLIVGCGSDDSASKDTSGDSDTDADSDGDTDSDADTDQTNDTQSATRGHVTPLLLVHQQQARMQFVCQHDGPHADPVDRCGV